MKNKCLYAYFSDIVKSSDSIISFLYNIDHLCKELKIFFQNRLLSCDKMVTSFHHPQRDYDNLNIFHLSGY